MAFAILKAAIGASIAGDTWDGQPGNHFELADQTGNTAQQNFVSGTRTVRAFVWVKSTAGGVTANVGTTFALQVADGTVMTPNSRVIASYISPLTPNAFYMNGVVPDNLSAAFCRVFIQLPLGVTLTYDVSIDAS